MRILHTSDLHLGASVAGASFTEDQAALVRQLLKTVREENIDAVIIAGDVFDRAVVSADAIAVYNQLMDGLCSTLHVPVLAVAGNHDGAARLASCSGLLARAGLYIAGGVREESGAKTVELSGCAFHLLPYFSLDEAKFLFPDGEVKTYNDAMRAFVGRVRSRFVPGQKNILVSHCYVSGAEVGEADRSVMVGGANMVSASLFDGFDYVALGHLHKAQDVGPAVRYAGAPGKLSFSEAGTEKTVTILDTEDMKRRTLPIQPLREMRVVSGTLAQTLRIAEQERGTDDYIKVELSDEYAHLEILDAFRSYYKNILALSGKAYRGAEELTSLSVEQVKGLSEQDIMIRFFSEYTGGEQPTKRQMQWFLEAVEKSAEGGEAQ